MRTSSRIARAGRILLLLFVIIAGLSAANAESDTDEPMIEALVILDRQFVCGTPPDYRVAASQTAASLGLETREIFTSAIFGFSTRLPRSRLDEIAADPRVEYVEPDFQVEKPPLEPIPVE